jgi:hypothetical protein
MIHFGYVASDGRLTCKILTAKTWKEVFVAYLRYYPGFCWRIYINPQSVQPDSGSRYELGFS